MDGELDRAVERAPSPMSHARVEMLEHHKQAEIESHARSLREGLPHTFRKPFGPPWGNEYWVKWATVSEALPSLGLDPGAAVLDVGCGTGWTTLFLAEAGYRALGLSLAPAEIEIAESRARRWGSSAQFLVGDMDSMALEQSFDGVLVFDALHHSTRTRVVVENIARHLRPGGWVLFGEPSVLHSVSPSARRAHRDLGWTEKGISVLRLKRACTAAGLGNFRRYFEGTRPYQRGLAGFGRQLVCLVAANFAFAPQTSVWLAAQKLSRP
jgi:2-polyprenyl-3-methyl-5-hydroxy-6-metoxy-1,4-benzoquinol methylase